jgi:hypothetical protein
MRDREQDRVDSGEIGRIQRVLPSRPCLRHLPGYGRESIDDRIQNGNGVNAPPPAFLLELRRMLLFTSV